MNDFKVKISAWLDLEKFNKQLNKLGKRKIKIDVNDDSVEELVSNLHTMNSMGTKSTSIFSKLKTVISETFSSGKLAMTGYLAVLQGIDTSAEKAKESIEELNKAETDLMIATDMSRESVRGLMKDYNTYAKQLASTTKNISDSANDYLRAGKSLEESKALIKDSIMLSKLGNIESATATEDLLATMNGYEMSIEKVDRALDAMVAVDMKAATSAGDLSIGLKYSASSAHSAGLSFNKLIAILGTVQDKTQQSAQVVGTFANQMLARYRDISIGKYLTDDGEDISNYESVLKSCGIELRNNQGEFRAFEDVLEEMASTWESLTSVQKNALIKVASGTRQQNRFVALMEGYNKVLELTEVAANSAGIAVDKFNSSYMTSLEAKENTLQASFESMIYNSDFEEVYGDILDATTALVDFINQTNALKGIMTGLVVDGGIKGFLGLKSGIQQAYVSLNQFHNAMQMINQTSISSADFKTLLLLTNGLSDSQIKLILSTQSLSLVQKEDILVARGLSREEAKLKLQSIGVTTAQTGLTVSTTSLKNAISALWNTMLANPIVLITTAVSTATMIFSAYKNHMEEVRQVTEESATAYKESVVSIDSYVSKYKELQKALQDIKGDEEATVTIKQQLLELQNELNDIYGAEYGKLNLVTEAYKDQTEAIKELSKAEADRFLNENNKGITTATKKMEQEKTYSLSYGTVSAYTDEGKILRDIASKYIDDGMIVTTDESNGIMNVTITADASTAYETINTFEADLRDKAQQLGNEALFNDVFIVSSEALNNAKSVVDEYGNIYQQALKAEIVINKNASKMYEEAISAVEKYNQAVVESESPFDDARVTEAKANLQTVKSEFSDTLGLEKFSTIFNDIFDKADTRLLDFNEKLRNDYGLQKLATQLSGKEIVDLKSMASDDIEDAFDKLIKSAEEYGLEISDVIDALVRLGYVQAEISNTEPDVFDTNKLSFNEVNEQIDSIQSAYKGLLTACEEYNQHGYVTADTLQTLLSLDGQYIACLVDENEQLAINGTAYQNLVKAKLAEAEATAVKQAIEELGTIITEQQISADTTAIGIMDEKETALASLTGKYASLANVAISAYEAQALADSYSDASSKNKDEADRIMSNLNAKLALIQNTATSTSNSFGALTNHLDGFTDSSGNAKNATDTLTKSMQKQKDALESTKSELEKQKQYYEDVAEAIDWFYDKQIDKQQKAIDKLEKENELLEERIDYYDGALSAIDRYYEKQIEKLEEEKNALAGNNKEVETAINLEKKQQELLEARSKKTLGLYQKGKGVTYVTDAFAIKTAEENLAEAQRQKEEADIDAKIEKLKEYQALWAEIPNIKQNAEEQSQMISLLGAEWESILLEGRIANFTSFKDQYVSLQQQVDNNESMIKSYEEKIAYYESLKLEWDNLLAKYQEDTYTQLLIGAFGNDFENELLNGRTGRWVQFAEDYYNIQVELKDVTDKIEALTARMEEYASRIESAANRAVSAVKKLKEAEAGIGSKEASNYRVVGNKVYTQFTDGSILTQTLSGKAKGGIITKSDAGDFDYIAKSVGEDHMVALTEGEAVIPKDTVSKNPEIVHQLIDGKDVLDKGRTIDELKKSYIREGLSLKTPEWSIGDTNINYDVISELCKNRMSMIYTNILNTLPKYNSDMFANNRHQETTVQFNGDIVLQGVQNVNTLAKDIKNRLANVVTQELSKRE